ncbi:MAG: HEPN family nuclease [Nitrospirae bacterium]|nr:HEPN family nuclease [Nitrospirota bacterium]MDA1304411.1 HEPN family nuclease [Nitrospirota bacterium]
MLDLLQGRNGSSKFARRSMKNLQFVLDVGPDADVHPVTQTISALLGIVVFPWEKGAFHAVKTKHLAIAHSEGWPPWLMSGSRIDSNKVKTIGNLLELLRNSVVHGNVTFDSDSKLPSEVTVTFENYPKGSDELDWKASIRADRLALFCQKFSGYVEDFVE